MIYIKMRAVTKMADLTKFVDDIDGFDEICQCVEIL